jgi:hypothetical protein
MQVPSRYQLRKTVVTDPDSDPERPKRPTEKKIMKKLTYFKELNVFSGWLEASLGTGKCHLLPKKRKTFSVRKTLHMFTTVRFS